jgi:hypothetical protein
MNVRLQIELPEKRVKELEALMEECDIATKKDLFNNALTLFEWAVRESEKGRIVASVDEENQRYRELQMPAFSTATARAKKAAIAESVAG